jgi:hypothetical protein
VQNVKSNARVTLKWAIVATKNTALVADQPV